MPGVDCREYLESGASQFKCLAALSVSPVDDTAVINLLSALAAVAQKGEEGARSVMDSQGGSCAGENAGQTGLALVKSLTASVSMLLMFWSCKVSSKARLKNMTHPCLQVPTLHSCAQLEDKAFKVNLHLAWTMGSEGVSSMPVRSSCKEQVLLALLANVFIT
eukprot:1159235-Pelagomonas_calceolata.AAC.16